MWSKHIDFHGGGDANLRKAKLIFLLAALAAAALFSCTVSESPASSDSGLVSMFREKLTEEAELSSSENTQILPSGIDDDATVYWVKSGSVYHRDPDCAQLRRSSDIMSGTAAQSGKNFACRFCCGKSEDNAEETKLPSGNAESTGSTESGGSANITETIPDESQTVYWTPGGSVYHSSKSCPSLAKSENVKSGTVKESGKSRLCKKCASR